MCSISTNASNSSGYRALQRPLDPGAYRGYGGGTGLAGDHLAVLHDHQRGYGLDREAGTLRVVVRDDQLAACYVNADHRAVVDVAGEQGATGAGLDFAR